MSELETMSHAVSRLREAGYEADYSARPEGLRCSVCGEISDAEAVTLAETVRFEGVTDPGDESALYGLSATACGHDGTLAVAFGPSASPEEVDVILALSRKERS